MLSSLAATELFYCRAVCVCVLSFCQHRRRVLHVDVRQMTAGARLICARFTCQLRAPIYASIWCANRSARRQQTLEHKHTKPSCSVCVCGRWRRDARTCFISVGRRSPPPPPTPSLSFAARSCDAVAINTCENNSVTSTRRLPLWCYIIIRTTSTKWVERRIHN